MRQKNNNNTVGFDAIMLKKWRTYEEGENEREQELEVEAQKKTKPWSSSLASVERGKLKGKNCAVPFYRFTGQSIQEVPLTGNC